MKTRWIRLAALVLTICIVLFTGCAGEKGKISSEKDISRAEIKEFQAKTGNELVKEFVKDANGKATEKEFGNLLETSKYFKNLDKESSDDFIIPENFTDAVEQISKANGFCDTGLAKKMELYKSKNPYVRSFAVYCIASGKDSVDSKVKLLMDIAKKEKNPTVKIEILNNMKMFTDDENVIDYYLKCAEDKDKEVRVASAGGLVSNLGDQKKKVKLAKILLKDKDSKVRTEAAYYAGTLEEDSMVEPLDDILNSSDSVAASQAARGLCNMWYGFPFYEYSNGKAYEAYISYLEKTKRDTASPDSFIITACLCSGADYKELHEFLDSKEWYQKERFVGVMKEIIKNPDTGFSVKNAALRVIGQYGDTKDLESIRESIEGWDSPSKDSLLESLDDLLTELKNIE